MDNNRLRQQIEFIAEIDRFKSVYRQSFLLDTSRHENDVEHSWHMARFCKVCGGRPSHQ